MRSHAVQNHRGIDSRSNMSSEGGGGHVEDILKRLGNVEANLSELKSEVSAIRATVSRLATKADVMDVRTSVADLRGEMATLETKIIKWIVATVLTTASLAFAIAKFVH